MFCKATKTILVSVGLLALFSCTREDLEPCGISLEFIHEYNMEYADAFQVDIHTVDVYVFDSEDKLALARSATRAELTDGNRLYLELPPGRYKILAAGNRNNDFTITPRPDNAPGSITLDEVRIALERDPAVGVSKDIRQLWFSVQPVEVENFSDPGVVRVNLMKYVNHFRIALESQKEKPDNTSGNFYFAIESSEGAVYGYDNRSLSDEKLTFQPYRQKEETVGEETFRLFDIKSCRLLENENYRFIIRDTNNPSFFWQYDLLKLLRLFKPDERKDGTPLPIQEYLDRRSEWDILMLWKRDPGGGLVFGLKTANWIYWIHPMDI